MITSTVAIAGRAPGPEPAPAPSLCEACRRRQEDLRSIPSAAPFVDLPSVTMHQLPGGDVIVCTITRLAPAAAAMVARSLSMFAAQESAEEAA